MKTWIIYVHTAPDGRRYVGQTQLSMERRWAQHVDKAGGSRVSTCIFTMALRRFPPETWTHEVVAICTMKFDANKAEKLWIKKLNTLHPHGLNLLTGG
jgi:predicted GIY-YIG superfamily endonuclease